MNDIAHSTGKADLEDFKYLIQSKPKKKKKIDEGVTISGKGIVITVFK